jgi:NAD/NADP transhydrogenase alpha subunit
MSPAFIEAEMALFPAAGEVDIIVTISLKEGPHIITAEMVRAMKRGSVVVDSPPNRGNCELTQRDKAVDAHGLSSATLTSAHGAALRHCTPLTSPTSSRRWGRQNSWRPERHRAA